MSSILDRDIGVRGKILATPSLECEAKRMSYVVRDIFNARYLLAQKANRESWEYGQIFFKTVLDYGNRSADICLAMQAVVQAGHSFSYVNT